MKDNTDISTNIFLLQKLYDILDIIPDRKEIENLINRYTPKHSYYTGKIDLCIRKVSRHSAGVGKAMFEASKYIYSKYDIDFGFKEYNKHYYGGYYSFSFLYIYDDYVESDLYKFLEKNYKDHIDIKINDFKYQRAYYYNSIDESVRREHMDSLHFYMVDFWIKYLENIIKEFKANIETTNKYKTLKRK